MVLKGKYDRRINMLRRSQNAARVMHHLSESQLEEAGDYLDDREVNSDLTFRHA